MIISFGFNVSCWFDLMLSVEMRHSGEISRRVSFWTSGRIPNLVDRNHATAFRQFGSKLTNTVSAPVVSFVAAKI